MGRNKDDVEVRFLGDTDSLAKAAARANRELASVQRKSHTVSTALGTALGTVAGKAIGGVASLAAGGIASLGGLASASIAAASTLNETLSKNKQVFGSNAAVVEAWAKDNTKNVLLTRQAAIEGAATFGNLFSALGIGQSAAAGMSTKLVGLASDLSSFNDVNTSEALQALQSGLLGEAEPLRKFGVSLSEARVEAEAYALGLAKPVKNATAITAANNAVAAAAANVVKVEKEHGVGTLAAAQARDKLARAEAALTKATAGGKATLTDAQKVQARQSIILKDTANAQGDAARTSDSYANSLRILKRDVGDASATLGTKLLPYASAAVKEMSKLVQEFEDGTGTGGALRQTLSDVAQATSTAAQVVGPLAGQVRDLGESFGGSVSLVKQFADSMGGLGSAVDSFNETKLGRILQAHRDAQNSQPSGPKPLILNFPNPLFLADGVAKQFGVDLGLGSKPKRKDTTHRDAAGDLPSKHGLKLGGDGRRVVDTSVSAAAAAREAATKTAAATKYATDKLKAHQDAQAKAVEAAAERKRKAADALAAANQKLRDALQARQDTANGIRDSLISSNSVLREGLSFTAKDLLARFRDKLAKVQQFSAAISAMVHKGYAPTIVQQVAEAGVGGLATARALASAKPPQVSAFNAADNGIQRAAAYAGQRVAQSVYGPAPAAQNINLVVDGKVLATAVNKVNAGQAQNGHGLARAR